MSHSELSNFQINTAAATTPTRAVRTSAWKIITLSLLALVTFIAVATAAAMMFLPAAKVELGTCTDFCGDQVYLAGEATAADVDPLGAELKNAGLFQGAGIPVQLEIHDGVHTLSFMLPPDEPLDQAASEKYLAAGKSLIASGFAKSVVMRLCREKFIAVQTIDVP